MAESQGGEGLRPVRLALLLALFLVPGAIGAAVLWHDVLNEVLAGRPMKASVWTVLGMLLLLGLSIGLLARYLRGGTSGGGSDRGGAADRESASGRGVGASDRSAGGTSGEA